MKRGISGLVALAALAALAAPVAAQDAKVANQPAMAEAPMDADAMIADALNAAPASVTAEATVMDWKGNTLREGANGWTCMPPPAGLTGSGPMCLDSVWMNWAHAWMNKTQPELAGVGVGYMLGGDTGASNTDPFATGPDAVDDWVDAGPHIMILAPDPAAYANLPTEPGSGAWVMWKDTPYAHVMIPTEGVKSYEKQ